MLKGLLALGGDGHVHEVTGKRLLAHIVEVVLGLRHIVVALELIAAALVEALGDAVALWVDIELSLRVADTAIAVVGAAAHVCLFRKIN